MRKREKPRCRPSSLECPFTPAAIVGARRAGEPLIRGFYLLRSHRVGFSSPDLLNPTISVQFPGAARAPGGGHGPCSLWKFAGRSSAPIANVGVAAVEKRRKAAGPLLVCGFAFHIRAPPRRLVIYLLKGERPSCPWLGRGSRGNECRDGKWLNLCPQPRWRRASVQGATRRCSWFSVRGDSLHVPGETSQATVFLRPVGFPSNNSSSLNCDVEPMI